MEIQKITFKSDGESLSGLIYIPERTDTRLLPSVVIFHGRGSNKDRYTGRSEALAKAGLLTFIFDFRGCGESEGEFKNQTIAMGFQDATAGYDYLVHHNLCDKKRIGVFGGSFGGYQAALLTKERFVKSLVLSAPAIYQDEWWDKVPESLDPERKALYRLQASISDTKAMKAIQTYSGALLVIEHEKDEVIPKRITRSYYKKALCVSERKIEIIRGAPHALHDTHFIQVSTDIIVAWFRRTL